MGLDLRGFEGTWIDVRTGERAGVVQGDAVTSIEAPATGPWVTAIIGADGE